MLYLLKDMAIIKGWLLAAAIVIPVAFMLGWMFAPEFDPTPGF